MSDSVSIVIPTFNRPLQLERTIRSCMDQTYCHLEIIIVDDASMTDETTTLINHYLRADPRIRAMRHDVNQGLPTALNTGFVSATGDLLTWISDDNYYATNAIEEMVRFLHDQEEVDIVYTDYLEIDESEHVLRHTSIEDASGLIMGNCIGPCFLYRRHVHETVGQYSEDLVLAEDFDFWLRASTIFRLAALREPLAYYRVHDGSLTAQYPEDVRLACEKALLKNVANLSWASASQKSRICLHLARQAYHRRDWPAVYNHLVLATSFSPRFCAKAVAQKLVGRAIA
jgi:glycosyltransferase involved in cell wall biosynthesis